VSALEAKLLLMQATGLNRTQLITQADSVIEHTQQQVFETLVERRLQGEPIAYLLGYREFFSLDFFVSPATLIPRPETECLVEQSLKILQTVHKPRILDLGTGSGVIGITLAYQLPHVHIVMTDQSADALAVAQQNAQRLLMPQTSCIFRSGDWWQALAEEDGEFDLIVSNPPYIAQYDPHLSQGDLRFEPQTALTDQDDGLSAIRLIIQGAPAYLRTGGFILLEHGYDQAQAVKALLMKAGFADCFCYHDYAGIPRVSGGRFKK
jgi:release factor glutamine methyltransferase